LILFPSQKEAFMPNASTQTKPNNPINDAAFAPTASTVVGVRAIRATERDGKIAIRKIERHLLSQLVHLAETNERSVEAEARFALRDWVAKAQENPNPEPLLAIKLVTSSPKSALENAMASVEQMGIPTGRYRLTVRVESLLS
jgi:plasmid stability protein